MSIAILDTVQAFAILGVAIIAFTYILGKLTKDL